MEPKDEVIGKLEKRIDGLRDSMACNIYDIQEILNEMDKSLNNICYLAYLKNDLIKKDGV